MIRGPWLCLFLLAAASDVSGQAIDDTVQDREAVVTATDAIQVRADAELIRERAARGGTLTSRHITALPLNGRMFVSLAALLPGVAVPQGSQLPRINGGRPRTNEYLFDGISVLQPEPGQIAFFPTIDAVEELRIYTNSPPAEFGRFNGGVINLTTKAGSNAFHGTAFNFSRHEALNARHVFAPAGAAKPQFRRNQFGAVLGGPIARNRTFFFVDYQGQQQTVARTVISTVPTELQRQGIFTEPIAGRVPAIYDPSAVGPTRLAFVGGIIPPGRIDPVALTLLNRYPHPIWPGTSNNFRRTDSETDDQNQWSGRVDHRWSRRNHVFGRLTSVRTTRVPVAPLPDGSGLTTGTLGPQTLRVAALATGYERIISMRALNQLRFGDTRRGIDRTAATLSEPAATALNIPSIPATGRFANVLPTFLISGYQQLGSPANTSSSFDTSVTEVADTLTWVTGTHTVKAGFDWRWQRLNVMQPPSPTGAFTFNSIGSDLPGTPNTGTPFASFLLGQVQSFSIDLQSDEIQERARFQEYFVQDDWRMTDRVTINAGMRYTLNFPSTEINGRTAVFNLETQLLDYPGNRPVRPLKKNDFGPRLGLVYRAGDQTLVSSGFGLVWIEMTGITTPFTTPTFPFLQTVSHRSLDAIAPAFVLREGPRVTSLSATPTAGLGQGVFGVDRSLGSGYVQQWNVSVQRDLTTNTAVDVAYVGSKITRVGIPDTNLNQLTVQQLALGNALLERVPNPYFGDIPESSSLGGPTISAAQLLKPYPKFTTVSLYRNNVGNTNYHGFTARIERRLSRGLSYLASYTRSRLMDDASSVFDASVLAGPVTNVPVADSFNRRLERDYSTGDIPHVFVASGVWSFRGWTAAGILTLQSGTPVAVVQATNFNDFAGFGTQRPNVVGDPELPARERSAARWFNTAAFTLAPQFTLGSSSRNPVRGPAYRNVDVAVSRRVRVKGQVSLELRGEVFNVLNTPALGNPNGIAGSPAFGSITTAGDPRVAQLAIKLTF